MIKASRDDALVSRRSVLRAGLSLAFLAVAGRAAARPLGERWIALENPHTGENCREVFWADGAYVPDALQEIDWVMRDFHCDAVVPIEPSLIDLLYRIQLRLGTTRPFRILSGYRSLETNELLREEGLHPAANSFHCEGKAADICIEKVRLRDLRRAALSLRGGGVGTYPRSHFIHVDVGPVRTWRMLR